MSDKVIHTVYVFDCPMHGQERRVFCFRAYEKENLERWTKMEYLEKSVPWNVGEFDKFHDAFVERARKQICSSLADRLNNQ